MLAGPPRPRIVTFLSATPQDDKGAMLVNLGASLARAGNDVVLVRSSPLERAKETAAPLADAWKAWTTSEGIQSFFAPEAVVEPRPDGAFFVHFNPYAKPGMKGADDMRVLAVLAFLFVPVVVAIAQPICRARFVETIT